MRRPTDHLTTCDACQRSTARAVGTSSLEMLGWAVLTVTGADGRVVLDVCPFCRSTLLAPNTARLVEAIRHLFAAG